jgi:polar amino acid transport system substrate-binding protein
MLKKIIRGESQMLKKIIPAILCVTMAMVVALPAIGMAGVLEDIQKRGELRIGVALEYPPVMFRDKAGNPTGFNVEVATMLAKDLKVKPVFVDMKWDGLIPALLSGKVDILLGSHTNTPERALAVNFSPRLEKTEVVLIVGKDNPMTSLDQLDAEGKKITCNLGSTSEKAAKMIFQKASIHSLPDIQSAFMEIESGRADACVTDMYMASPYTRKHAETTKIMTDDRGDNIVVSREYGHAAMRKQDMDLWVWVMNWIDYYRAAGTLDALEDNWIGAFLRGEKTW